MDSQTAEYVGVGVGAVLLSVLTSLGVTKKQLRDAPTPDTGFVASIDSRVAAVSKDVVDRSHDMKNALQILGMSLSNIEKQQVRLEVRVERSEKDIDKNYVTVTAELRRLEEKWENHFREINIKLDNLNSRRRVDREGA